MYYKCPKCNGSGKISDIDPFMGILTLGITTLIDMGMAKRCPLCKGEKVLKEPD